MATTTATALDIDRTALPLPARPMVATHWGLYRAAMRGGRPVALEPYEADPVPSPIGQALIGARLAPARILRPAVRKSYLERGHAAGGEGRGGEPFVEVDWDTAERLVASELERVRKAHGNRAIYGSSNGWSSAGRFHHAQSQVHRFLNSIGGYVRSVHNYSFGAADVILPYVLGGTQGLVSGHTPWSLIAGHCDLIVMLGGLPLKNTQVSSGGIARHGVRSGVEAAQAAGAQFVNVSPIRDDALASLGAQWLAVRPNTDTALMLGLAHVLIAEGLHDAAFLERYTTGFDKLAAYIRGDSDGEAKSPEWAARICGVGADAIRTLARRMAGGRTLITLAWSLQRADHGEQPYWMAAALAAMLGQIGLPGGGIGYGYAGSGGIGIVPAPVAWPALPQGRNPIDTFIPVARIADMLLSPGQPYDYNGRTYTYPDIRLVYWGGGNPFHHHQDLNRLVTAWRRPETVIVHEQFWNAMARHADIVLPSATQLERNDIAASGRDRFLAASHKLCEPPGEARTDFDIFSALSSRLGAGEAYTEGRDEAGWLRHLYAEAARKSASAGRPLPPFEAFWEAGVVEVPGVDEPEPLLAQFRADPVKNKLPTPSGRIELYSERIAGYGYDDCLGHPAWLAPKEWLGAELASTYPLHLMSNQPATKLHSQYDHGEVSRAAKIAGREPIRLNPADARRRGIESGMIVRVFNGRGAILAGAVIDDAVREGVAQIATGAWYDPETRGLVGALDKHGNPNVLTADHGTSRLAQAPSANSCLVEVEGFQGEPPALTCFEPPEFVGRK